MTGLLPESNQASRLSDALVAGHFNVDEMSFETLLVFAKQLASELHFYDQKNNQDGTWEPMFLASELAMMAMLQSMDCDRISIEFEESLQQDLQASTMMIITLLANINLWYQQLKLSNSEAIFEFCLKISSAVDKKLQPCLQQLQAAVAFLDLEQQQLAEQKIRQFDPIWGDIVGQWQPDNSELDLNQLSAGLQQNFSNVINVVRYLQMGIGGYTLSLENHSDHDPSMGLFMAFLKVFRHSQQKLNRFTMRHLDLYYRKILKFEAAKSTPESVHLLVTPTKGLKQPVLIPKGTEFSCGKDSNQQEIIFCLDSELLLSDAEVKSVFNLYLHRDPLISPESELHYVTQVTKNQLQAETSINTDFTTFGANERFGKANASLAPLGFAISAPVLNLREGLRELSLTIALAEPYPIPSHAFYLLNTATSDTDKNACILAIFTHLLEVEPSLYQGKVTAEKLLNNLSKEQQMEMLLSADEQQSFIHKNYLLSLLAEAQEEALFYRLLGRLFSRHTLHRALQSQSNSWLNQVDIEQIKTKSQQFTKTSGLKRLLRLLSQDQLRTFNELYEKMFDIKLSTEEGWLKAKNYRINPLSKKIKGDEHGAYGFQFIITLTPDLPAVTPVNSKVHGNQWQCDAGMVQFSIKPLATFFPYSIFRGLILSAIDIEADVKGVTELVAYNNHGRVDPAKTFVPFGAQPTRYSYLVLGSEEMAKKQVVKLDINLNWSGLPTVLDGFKTHYAGYDFPISNDTFQADLEVLRDGSWLKVNKHKSIKLFEDDSETNRLNSFKVISSDISNEFKPAGHNTQNHAFDYNLKSRNGFIKLLLSEPDIAFGHQEYSRLLTNMLVENARSKKPKPLPNLPYTPALSRLSVNYCANTVIHLHPQNQKKNLAQHSVTHIHPFGFQQIYPISKHRQQPELKYLFPRYASDGNLFIGIESLKLADMLTLFFHFDEKASLNPNDKPSDIQWFYLSHNRWLPFSNRQIMSDTTFGLTTSGIMSFMLPETFSIENTVMPKGLFWLRACANQSLSSYGRCLSISTHAGKATRQAPGETPCKILQLPTKWKTLHPVAGLDKVSQVTVSFDGKKQESEGEFKQRVSERLRHKGRAVSSWDYEHLILEAFPEIDRVKCISNCIFNKQNKQPGHLLIIVRPKVNQCQHQLCDDFNISRNLLNKVQQFIALRAPQFIKIDVRGPVYESVQVRCAVKFLPGLHAGLMISKLNQDICDFLCPWSDKAINTGFGWLLKTKDIDSYIRQLNYIKFVTDVSALHIIKQTQQALPAFQLADSVAADGIKQSSPVNQIETGIEASAPWCLLMPYSHQVIEIINEEIDLKPTQTGISELEVGGNFIIGDDEGAKQYVEGTQQDG
ncbi:baseplate J/gp47 family protein [Shewanella sp. UCD-KL12]|uniref:baseplate J/gp47 family protein n=1 Tax=Shewanella sp. UCD-KL12 TaxID=1917163 RepID=UPI0015C30107|nr:baseplate J/gp47 family protein [Shewanella sp. UCD-KL12]